MKQEYRYTDEELLHEAGAILAEGRLAEFEKNMGEEHAFSPRFERKARKLLANSGAGRPAPSGRRWT